MNIPKKRQYNLSVLLWPFRAKKNKHHKMPIYCRITVNGKLVQMSTKIFIEEQDWDSEKLRIKETNALAQIYNARLEQLIVDVNKCFYVLETMQRPITAAKLKAMVKGEVRPSEGLLQVAEKFLASLKNDLQPATMRANISYYKCFEAYLKEIKRTQLECEEIDLKFTVDYERFLRDVKRYKGSHVVKMVGFVKRVLNYACLLQIIEHNPIALYTVKNKAVRPILFLEEEELSRLMHYPFASQKLQRVADLFTFQCWTGLSFSDTCEFDLDKLDKSLDGNLWISYERQKVAGSRATLPLLPEAKTILEKYDYQLPIVSNGKYNLYLKEIADVIGINKHLTTHVGRKTFGMLMLNRGIPIETVSRMLGHADIRQTQKAYARILDRKIAQDMKEMMQVKEPQEGGKMVVLR